MSDKTTIAKFGGGDFEKWSSDMENLLMRKGFWGYVNGRNQKPHLADPRYKDPEVLLRATEMYHQGDEAAMGCIGEHLELSIKKEVRETKTAKERWDYLTKKYSTSASSLSSFDDMCKLFDTKFTGDTRDQLQAHFNELLNLNGNLPQEHRLSDHILGFIMIRSLPKGGVWDTITQSALDQTDRSPTKKHDPIAIRTLYMHRIVFSDTLVNTSTPSTATSTATSTPAITPTSLAAVVEPRTKKKGKGGKAGVNCSFCHRSGHDTNSCWQLVKEQEEAAEAARQAVKARVVTSKPKTSMAALAPVQNTSNADPPPSGFFSAVAVEIQVNLASKLEKAIQNSDLRDAIIVDCGCNSHMSPHRHYFDDEGFTELVTPIPIKVGNLNEIYASHRGSITFICRRRGTSSTHTLRLENVLYCKDIATTLLSPQKIIPKGFQVILDNDPRIVHSNSNTIVAYCPLSPTTNLFQLSGMPVKSQDAGPPQL